MVPQIQTNPYQCHYCKQVFQRRLKRCGGCKGVYYCDKSCQIRDFYAGHRDECKELKSLVQKRAEERAREKKMAAEDLLSRSPKKSPKRSPKKKKKSPKPKKSKVTFSPIKEPLTMETIQVKQSPVKQNLDGNLRVVDPATENIVPEEDQTSHTVKQDSKPSSTITNKVSATKPKETSLPDEVKEKKANPSDKSSQNSVSISETKNDGSDKSFKDDVSNIAQQPKSDASTPQQTKNDATGISTAPKNAISAPPTQIKNAATQQNVLEEVLGSRDVQRSQPKSIPLPQQQILPQQRSPRRVIDVTPTNDDLNDVFALPQHTRNSRMRNSTELSINDVVDEKVISAHRYRQSQKQPDSPSRSSRPFSNSSGPRTIFSSQSKEEKPSLYNGMGRDPRSMLSELVQRLGKEGLSGMPSPQRKTIEVTYWKDGFQIDGGKLLDYTNDRYRLLQLKPRFLPPGVEVEAINNTDKKFPRGRTLGSSLPANQVSAVPIQMSKPTGSTYQADLSKPHTTVQIRLPDGQRRRLVVNMDDPIQVLKQYLLDEVPIAHGSSFQLQTAFPRKILSEFQKTFNQAGLKNCVVSVSIQSG